MKTEAWQRGPLDGYEPLLMPAAHSFVQVREEIENLAPRLPEHLVWQRPSGAASVGFHLRHVAGSIERLLTYARGEALTPAQLAAAARESTEQVPLDTIVRDLHASIDRALAQLRSTPVDTLLQARKVGRAGLPSTTLGLLFHAAEHATRHAGQAITTARILGVSAAP